MRISKTRAEQIAKKLCSQFEEKIKQLETEKNNAIEDEIKKGVPGDVMAFFGLYRLYVQSTNWFKFTEGELTGYSSTVKNNYPSANGLSHKLTTTTEIVNLVNKIKSLKEKRDKALLDIEASLLSLGTAKKIIAEFPQLKSEFYVTNTAVAVMPENTRQLINCLVNGGECVQ